MHEVQLLQPAAWCACFLSTGALPHCTAARSRLHARAHRAAQLDAQHAAGGSLAAGSAQAAAAQLAVRWVRLAGMLYDRINLEGWPVALPAATAALQVCGVGARGEWTAYGQPVHAPRVGGNPWGNPAGGAAGRALQTPAEEIEQ